MSQSVNNLNTKVAVGLMQSDRGDLLLRVGCKVIVIGKIELFREEVWEDWTLHNIRQTYINMYDYSVQKEFFKAKNILEA